MTATNVRVQMQQRRDTAANWTSADPTLLAGELGYESDTGKLKIGDGSTAWSSLAYEPGFSLSAYPLATSDIADDAITGDKLANDITIANDLTVTNNLTVNGTTTTINSTTLQVDDKSIELGTVATPSDATADGGGITLKGTTDHTILWTDSTDSWDFSEHVNIASGKEFRINGTKVLDATGLGSAVVSSSLTSVGTIATGVWNGTAIATAYIADDAVTADKLADTAVTAGSYTAADITVDAQGRITAASSGTVPDSDKIEEGNTSVEVIDTGSDGRVVFTTEGSEAARIDSSGRLLVGTSSAASTSAGNILQSIHSSGSSLILGRNDSSVGDGELIGAVRFFANDPSGYNQVAAIVCDSEGSHNSNDYPTRLEFYTTADGEGSPTQRMRIDSSGKIRTPAGSSTRIGIDDRSSAGNGGNLIISSGGAHGSGNTSGDLILATSRGVSGGPTGIIKFGYNDGTNGLDLDGSGEWMRIDSSGNVGIGGTPTNASDHKSLALFGNANTGAGFIEFNDTSGNADAAIFADNGNLFINADYDNTTADSTIRFRLDGSQERMRIDSSGNLNFSQEAASSPYPEQKLKWSNDNTTSNGFFISQDSDRNGKIFHEQGLDILFGTNNTERMRIDSSGIVKIGTGSTVTPDSNADDFVIDKGAADTGLSILSTTTGRIYFGDAADDEAGSIRYVHSDNSMRFETASSERLRIDSSGNVGIGTSSPLRALHVAGAGDTGLMLQTTNAVNDKEIWEIQAAGDASNHANLIFRSRTNAGTGGTEAMRIDSSGNVAIGKTSASAKLDVNGNVQFGDGGGFDMNINGTRHQFSIDGTERMRIASGGSLLLNTTSEVSSGFISVVFSGVTHNGMCMKTTRTTDGSDFMVYLNSSGNVAGRINHNGTTTVSYTTSSDYRLKENVADIADGITRVKQLAPKRFNFIEDGPDKVVDGFLAHEAQAVVPEAVTGTHNEVDDDGNAVMQGIDQSKLVPLLTAALKEAIAKIETLETKVAALEAG
jgi:hypothetical protein